MDDWTDGLDAFGCEPEPSTEPSIPAKPASKGRAGRMRPIPTEAEIAAAKRVYFDLRDKMLTKYVYDEPEMLWYNVDTLTGYQEKAFNRRLDATALSAAWHASNPDSEAPRSAASLLLPSIRRFDTHILVFGAGRVIDHECSGIIKRCLNRYTPGTVVPHPYPQAAGDVATFVSHIEAICAREPASAKVLLDWMAWVIQHPGEKVRWAPLIYAPQGIGKDSLLRPLIEIIGQHNCDDISPSQLEENFNTFDAKKLIVLNEMLNNARYSTYDRIKPKISGTGSGYIVVNEKYLRPYSVKNVSAWVVFTNHPDAMPMEEGDRRFFVLHGEQPCPAARKEAYFAAYHDWLSKGGTARLYRWLLDRDVRSFNPNQPPADTEAKHEMRWEAMTDAGRWLASHCTAGAYANRTILTRHEIEALGSVEDQAISSRKLTEGLRAGGFESIGVHPIAAGRTNTGRKTTFYARDGIRWDAATTRDRMFAEMQPQTAILLFGIDPRDLPAPPANGATVLSISDSKLRMSLMRQQMLAEHRKSEGPV